MSPPAEARFDSIASKWATRNADVIGDQIVPDTVSKELGVLAPGARVLELACGTGGHTKIACDQGAAEVVALDISPAMIETARATFAPEYRDRVAFGVADGSDPQMWQHVEVLAGREHTFDVVLAVWFLNYARTQEYLTRMLVNMRKALKPGGRVIALTVPAGNIEAYRPPHKTGGKVHEVFPGVVDEVVEVLEGGYKIQKTFASGVQFDFYFLGLDVYTRAARDAGVVLEWKAMMPEPELVEKTGDEYWKPWFAKPNGAVCVFRE